MTTDLQEAFREAARREFAMVPDENELDYAFSSGFQRKMQRIIRAQVHGYWNMVNTLGKRIAIAAAIIVMLLTTAMAIKPIRERVIKFFIEIYEEYYEIRFGENTKDDIDPNPPNMIRYTLSALPTDYYQEEFLETEHLLWTCWYNDDGLGISLKQELGTNEIILDNQGTPPQETYYGETSVIIQQQEEASVYIWRQDNYIFYLTCHESLQQKQVEQLITSLVIKN